MNKRLLIFFFLLLGILSPYSQVKALANCSESINTTFLKIHREYELNTLYEKAFIENDSTMGSCRISNAEHYEISTFMDTNKDVLDTLTSSIIKLFKDEILLQSIQYKCNPIVVTMEISLDSGNIYSVCYRINNKISNLISYQDIINMESIVRNTKFHKCHININKKGTILIPITKSKISIFLKNKK